MPESVKATFAKSKFATAQYEAQQQHLQDWEQKLKPEVFATLKERVDQENSAMANIADHLETIGVDIKTQASKALMWELLRGSHLLEIVLNWPRKDYFKSTARFFQ